MFICSKCGQSVKGSKEHRVAAETRDIRYKNKHGLEKVRKEIAKEHRLCDNCFDVNKIQGGVKNEEKGS